MAKWSLICGYMLELTCATIAPATYGLCGHMRERLCVLVGA